MSYLQYLLIAGTYTAEALQGMMMVVDNIADAYEAHSDLVKLMERLEANPERFKRAMPEVKGDILYKLTDTNFITHNLSFAVQNNDIFSGESVKGKWSTLSTCGPKSPMVNVPPSTNTRLALVRAIRSLICCGVGLV